MILGFQSQFVPMVLDGTKRHTIRAGFRWKLGAVADLYTGPYRAGCRKLLFRAPVTSIERVEIEYVLNWGLAVTLGGRKLALAEREQFFYADGFGRGPNYQWGFATVEASKYFKRPLIGQLIHWDYEAREPK